MDGIIARLLTPRHGKTQNRFDVHESEASMVHARLSHLPSPSLVLLPILVSLSRDLHHAQGTEIARISNLAREPTFSTRLSRAPILRIHVLLTFSFKYFFIDLIDSLEERILEFFQDLKSREVGKNPSSQSLKRNVIDFRYY